MASHVASDAAVAPYRVPVSHLVHPSFGHPLLASWSSVLSDGAVPPASLVWPLFLVDADDAVEPIASMPGQYRWGVGRLAEALDVPVARGLRAVLLFGVLGDARCKDGAGSSADAPGSPVLRAIALLRARYPSLLVMCDVCLCGYTDHGHCGVLAPGAAGDIDNDASVARVAAVGLAFARAGAHVLAPSDMMDGRVGAIKDALARAGGGLASRVAVMSYAAKFASCLYGPFRDAAHSGMAFGDRWVGECARGEGKERVEEILVWRSTFTPPLHPPPRSGESTSCRLRPAPWHSARWTAMCTRAQTL